MTISKARKQSKSDTALLHNGLLNATTGSQEATTHRNVQNEIDRQKRRRQKKLQRQRCSSNNIINVLGEWMSVCVSSFLLCIYRYMKFRRDGLRCKKELKFSLNSTLYDWFARIKRFVVLVWIFFINSIGLAFTHSLLKWMCLVCVELFIQVKDYNSHGFLQLTLTRILHHVPRPMCFTTYPNHPMQFFHTRLPSDKIKTASVTRARALHTKKSQRSFALLPTIEESKRV